MSTTIEIELVPSEEESLLDTFEVLELEPKHTISLSHSGAQKNFVEQLCEDLERVQQTPFFDKRPDSLPKGEIFAQYIFKAAQQCELAIVVVSEEYFSRSKWPMLELCAFVQSSKCKILPLFFGLSSKDFGNPERRERWVHTWEAWAQADPRVQVGDWKNAVREVDRRNGLEYVEALGEVGFRKDVVATVCGIMRKSLHLQDKVHEQVPPHLPLYKQSLGALKKLLPLIILKTIGAIVGYLIFIVLFMLVVSKIIFPIFELIAIPKGFPKGL